MPQSVFTRGYNSISGINIEAVIGSRTFATLQGVSYSVTREKSPVYTLGSADPRAFSRGKRAIAGSLVFIQFDNDPVLEEFANLTDPTRQFKFLAHSDDLRPEYVSQAGQVSVSDTVVTPVGETSANAPGTPVDAQESQIATVGGNRQAALAWYADQIPPFDIVLSAANEYGAMAIMKILGIELMNQGFGISIDDIVAEHSYTYIATGILPWTTQGVHPDMQSTL